jgi:hypothetical protein
MKIGYARVSTQDQSTDLQLDALTVSGCERIFSEKASGAKTDRPELLKALEYARQGDVIVVWKLDRLARSMKQLIETMEMLRERGIAKEVSDTITGTVLNFAKDEIQKVKVRWKTGFKEIAKNQYEKCSRVKTLVQPAGSLDPHCIELTPRAACR